MNNNELLYYPYRSDKPNKKYFIFNADKKKIYFGDPKYQSYDEHKDPERKRRYILRHKKKEDWNNPNTAGFWSRWLLWEKPNINDAYKKIIDTYKLTLYPHS
jgi:hypothetical protein